MYEHFFLSLHIMATATSMTCGPMSDTSSYTHSDLDTGWIAPTSCFGNVYRSETDGYDFWTRDSKYDTLRITRGRDPACFPKNYPAACQYTSTFEQALDPIIFQLATTLMSTTLWSEKDYVYSPATCPSGYIAKGARANTASVGTTSAFCCPS